MENKGFYNGKVLLIGNTGLIYMDDNNVVVMLDKPFEKGETIEGGAVLFPAKLWEDGHIQWERKESLQEDFKFRIITAEEVEPTM
jgi:hypothetical protein